MISFGDGALDLRVTLVSQIPVGYLVALLDEGEEPPSDAGAIVDGTDVVFRSAGFDGVRYQRADSAGAAAGPILLKPWTDFARIHIY